MNDMLVEVLLNKKQSALGRAISEACLEACMTLLESARRGI